MAIWLVRAGSDGEYEEKFVQENRIYATWDDLDVNLSALDDRHQLTAAMEQRYPHVLEFDRLTQQGTNDASNINERFSILAEAIGLSKTKINKERCQ